MSAIQSVWSNVHPTDRRTGLIIATLGLALGGLYFIAIDLNDPAFIVLQQGNVIAGIAGSPYRYRVLVPFLLEAGTGVFALFEPRTAAFLHASLLYDCLGLMAQLLALYALVRQWFSPRQSLIGIAFISSVTQATFGYFSYQPWSILEVALFCLGFLFAYRGHWGRVGVTVVLAALNRETGIFLPLGLLLAYLELPRPFSLAGLRLTAGCRETRLAFVYVVLSTAIFGGLRLVRGSAGPVDELGFVLQRNLERNNLIAAGLAVPLFLGIGWIFALRGVARAPRFIRRIARVVPLYLAAFAVWGWWREVRILTTLYPIVLPLVLAYCYLPRSTEVRRPSP